MVSLEHDDGWNSSVSVNIQSCLPGGEPQGTFTIKVPSMITAKEVLLAVCKEAGIPFNPHYVLRTCEGTVIPMNTKIISFSSVLEGKDLRWDIADESEITTNRKSKCCNTYCFLAVLSFLIGCGGLIAVCIIYMHVSSNLQYGIVFDAGSSHTSMFIYKWEGEKINKTAVAIQDGAPCTADGGGISSYANNSAGAGQSLVKCLNMAKDSIPAEKQSSTLIYLGATAGMRLLRKENPNASEAVLESVRSTISTYPFKFTDPKQQARIIPGEEEGAFSWITSNYLTGAFDVHPPIDDEVPELFVSSVGALDMGGASTQITFVPNKTQSVPADFQFLTSLYGTNYSLYTHSFLCYGVNQAAIRLKAALIEAANFSSNVSNPCGPQGGVLNVSHSDVFSSVCVSGEDAQLTYGHKILAPEFIDQDAEYYLHGESNPAACKDLVTKSLFNLTAPCPYDRCSFNGIYQPPVTGDFYAISSYFYLMQFLNLTDSDAYTIDYTNFTSAAQSLCTKNWDEVKHMKTAKPANLPYYCFQAMYIDTILVDGYKFEPNSTWKSVHFVETVFGVDVGWSLGFIINESNKLPSKTVSKDLNTVTFVLLAVLFGAFVITTFCFLRLARRQQRGCKLGSSVQASGYGAI